MLASADRALLTWARTHGHDKQIEQRIAGLSRLGEHAAIWLAIGAVCSVGDRRAKRAWRGGMRKVASAYVVNTAIKFTVRRRRPALEGLPALTSTPSGLSLPSAHATTAFAAARAYSRLGLPASLLYGSAAAFAYSRLYLGVHYPSDVLAGALLGSLMASDSPWRAEALGR